MKKIFSLLLAVLIMITPLRVYANNNNYLTNDLISPTKYSIKSPYNMEPKGICMHNTWNTASARNEAAYMKNNNKRVSFHIAVDEKEALLLIPLDRNAWHAGDSYGNRNFIGIEICRSRDYSTNNFAKAEENAVKVVASLCIEYGWDHDVDTYVKAHRDFSGKNCPHRTDMNDFKARVKSEISRQKNKDKSKDGIPLINNKHTNSSPKNDKIIYTVNKKNKNNNIVSNGWILVDNKYKYVKNNKEIKNDIVRINGKLCYFDEEGF